MDFPLVLSTRRCADDQTDQKFWCLERDSRFHSFTDLHVFLNLFFFLWVPSDCFLIGFVLNRIWNERICLHDLIC